LRFSILIADDRTLWNRRLNQRTRLSFAEITDQHHSNR